MLKYIKGGLVWLSSLGWFLWIRKILRTPSSANLSSEKKINQWRIIDLGDSGVYVYVDPRSEKIRIFSLTRDEMESKIKLHGSVSGLQPAAGDPFQSVFRFRKQVPYGS